MPLRYTKHSTQSVLEQELRAIWEVVDKLTRREMHLRQHTAGVPGGPAAVEGSGGVAGGGSPVEAEYLLNTLHGDLANARRLVGLAGQIDLDDGGAGGDLTISILDDGIALAKLADIPADVLVGRATAGVGDWELITCTAAARAILDDASAAAMRATLGLGDLATISSPLPIANGGTGQASQTAAFNALDPLTTLGDTLYHNGTDSVRLAGNTAATKKFLSQTGTGAVSAAPSWLQPDHGELSGLGDDDHAQYLLADGTRLCSGLQEFSAGILLSEGQDVQFYDGDFGGYISLLAAPMPDGSTHTLTLPHATGRLNGTVFVETTAVGNVGSGEDLLMSWAMPASQLNTNEDYVEIICWGTTAANNNAKRLKLYFGATAVYDSGVGTSAANNNHWVLRAFVVRRTATTQTACSTMVANNSGALPYTDVSQVTAPGETLSNSITIQLTGEATSNDDVKCEGMIIRIG